MSGAIAVFVKTPGLSAIKTRLAVQLGNAQAEAFHLVSAQAVVAAVKAASQMDSIQSFYAVAEHAALQHGYWQDLPCVWQGEGGLGERMAQVYQTLLAEHEYVILVGADIPQMTAAELASTFAWLKHQQHPRLAFGPSLDGGFWLFGGNCNVPQSIWTDVTYSVADTGTQFLKHIQQLGELKTMTRLRDIDEPSDLIHLHTELLALSEPQPAQQQLIRFLQTLDLNNSSISQALCVT